MKILQINAFSNGSTGKIMFSIHKKLIECGHDSYVIWSIGKKGNNKNEFLINDKIGELFHKVYSRLSGKQGFASWNNTRKIIKKIEKINPDIIQLHNLHNNSVNIDMLFKYIKKKNIKVYWTFHDCWAFTGKCVHFEMAKCFKWKKECYNCPMLNDRPIAYVDRTNWLLKKKKELLFDLDLTVVTPSEWLAKYVKESFLKDKSIYVINNGIDLNVFKKTNSDFRKKYNVENKRIILGVASTWSKRKGIDDFIKLANIIDDTYKIVLVGLSKKQLNIIPDNIIGITRTENQEELAGIYSTADVLLNPTYEDTYPTINLEAIACGTPVLTYDTGGSPEFLKYIYNKNDIEYILKKSVVRSDIYIIKKQIENVINQKESFSLNDRKLLSEERMVNEYIKLYEKCEVKANENSVHI